MALHKPVLDTHSFLTYIFLPLMQPNNILEHLFKYSMILIDHHRWLKGRHNDCTSPENMIYICLELQNYLVQKELLKTA